MVVAQIKMLWNKWQAVVKQMRRDIALLLQFGHDATARIRVELFIELFYELIVSRLSIITKQRECLPNLKGGIASFIFASSRCSEISELISLWTIFEEKYGKYFVSAAIDVRRMQFVDSTSAAEAASKFASDAMAAT
ncbi:IST1-like protein [Pyrus ussuriensis x Pyrus communis]|uniref:IST1-like protein n=1 Tax=Pyrus ussuriensis x Pyrus communis TaxID=2448454 RepID=A0A5N5FN62_9ROSA|nr:IST1-like protein [Pyrus ussuriensis x Pyrus communis]